MCTRNDYILHNNTSYDQQTLTLVCARDLHVRPLIVRCISFLSLFSCVLPRVVCVYFKCIFIVSIFTYLLLCNFRCTSHLLILYFTMILYGVAQKILPVSILTRVLYRYTRTLVKQYTTRVSYPSAGRVKYRDRQSFLGHPV